MHRRWYKVLGEMATLIFFQHVLLFPSFLLHLLSLTNPFKNHADHLFVQLLI